MKKQSLWVATLASLTLLTSISAQTPPAVAPLATKLPDISMMGNFQFSAPKEGPKKHGFSIKEVELAIQGYLYPTVRGDVFIGLHQEDGGLDVHLEEAFLTFSGVSEGVGIKAGKKLLSVGKQNVLHPEQWAWIDKPLVIADFLGKEGLSAEGVSVEYLLPLPFFLQADLGVWQQNAGHHDDEEDAEDSDHEDSFSWSDWLANARIWSSVAPAENMEMEMGVSYLQGHGPEHKSSRDDVRLLGGDLTLRYWMADGAKLIVQGEFLGLRRELADETLSRWGWYSYAGYRPSREWEFGLRGDYSESAEETKDMQKAVSAIGTYQLTETSKFRLQYTHDLEGNNHGVFAQILFGVGPHSHVLQ